MTDLIVTMALELGRAVEAYRAADEKRAKAPKNTAGTLRHRREEEVLLDRMGALDHMILTGKACSAEGAMVQVMMVASHMESLGSPGENLNVEETARRCDGALASALAALEEATGLQREDIGGNYYALRELDIFAEDLAAA